MKTRGRIVSALLFAVSILPGLAQFPVPGMSNDCLQDLCEVYKSITTCPVFNIGWDGVCSEYFLGYLFGCPDYPGKDEIYEAPSVCLEQYLQVIIQVKQGLKPVNPAVIAAGSYEEYCYENCFQKYVDKTEVYNQQCSQYITSNFTAASETLVAFRGIACGETNYTDRENVNCYDELMEMQAGATPGAPSPLTDFTCTTFAGQYAGICTSFSMQGCCWGNQAVMLGQTLMKPLPPCLNKECVSIAPILDICDRHINYETGSIQTWVYLDFPPPALPNMYVNQSVLMLQGALLVPLGLLPTKATVFDFTYFNNGAEITANNPTAMSTATSGNFSVLITIVQATEAEINQIFQIMASPAYAAGVQQAFKNAGTVTVGTVATRHYASDQIVTDNAASHVFPFVYSALGAFMLSFYLLY